MSLVRLIVMYAGAAVATLGASMMLLGLRWIEWAAPDCHEEFVTRMGASRISAAQMDEYGERPPRWPDEDEDAVRDHAWEAWKREADAFMQAAHQKQVDADDQ